MRIVPRSDPDLVQTRPSEHTPVVVPEARGRKLCDRIWIDTCRTWVRQESAGGGVEQSHVQVAGLLTVSDVALRDRARKGSCLVP